MQKQYTSNLLMVRPSSFQFNTETAKSNVFQKNIDTLTNTEILNNAIKEFDNYVLKLRNNNIEVLLIDDTQSPSKPDALFPNNWISTHPNGHIYLYPMCTPNRRLERRLDILEILKENFEVNEIIDLSATETENIFLEGTGSIIFDHINKIAYACLSDRTNKELFISHCEVLNYENIFFSSFDKNNFLVYHTNVMLTIGDKFAIVCLESITDKLEKLNVINRLETTNHEIIDITFEQMSNFAGNMLQVSNKFGKTFLVMSQTAYNSLQPTQVQQIEKYTTILAVDITTIETIGGGSARCMLAELYLLAKKNTK